ncbi:hypothetical protein CH330_09610 [candidate division WOR-3 bacterium JGI_Cruoil_03_51_56]|uniref:4-fold beta flower domain-containing protein n=1 Tax=candidate division WOR-3 bacterium JGI_Cruoil_03_51_56 TaxID=1973747 RepID=A0A235BPC9_UNCW3|nr:MAG: hypothetical protein CH330_09610 [candidate division WOR-3 bacterium JGI_Cruoil_03_51_56]
MDEEIIYDRFGNAVYRLCGKVFYDYHGKPRGFLVGKTIYDLRKQHRGFYIGKLARDRMGKIIGFASGASTNGLALPLTNIPPVPYDNLPPPELPADLLDRKFNGGPPVWSIMQLQNLLV